MKFAVLWTCWVASAWARVPQPAGSSAGHSAKKGHSSSSSSSEYLPLADFASPPLAFHPKFRYWLPDASVDVAAVDADIAAMAAAGAGGLELIPFFNYGMPPVTTDWGIYGFGTPAWAKLQRSVLASAARHGLRVDLALGANQGQGVPAAVGADEPLTSGRAVELVYGVQEVNATDRFPQLPSPNIDFNFQSVASFINTPELWGPSELVAAVAVRIVAQNDSLIVLDEAVDVTDWVVDGAVNLTALALDTSAWQLLAFYQHHSNERSCISVVDASDWRSNGSWIVDHFSATGAQLVTAFWDAYLLDAETRSLLQQVGDYTWEDSMEMINALWWTPSLPALFHEHHGYAIAACLPVLFQVANAWDQIQSPYDATYVWANASDACAQDYRLTLNAAYRTFLDHYRAWAAGLGLQHSCQPAYNLPLDLAADLDAVAVPEIESLGFDNQPDNYLYAAGAVHLAGGGLLSSELGAEGTGAYAQTVVDLVNLIRGSLAAGVNAFVLHGFAYGGNYSDTTWPGYTPFHYRYSEMWGPRQPAWQHINDSLAFAARSALACRAGVPRRDLAVFRWTVPWNSDTVHDGPDALLRAAGFSHDYIGTDGLVSLAAANTPAYRAVVLYRQALISPAAAAALVSLAAAGVPILAVGNVPNTTIGANGQEAVSADMADLVRYANVALVDDDEAIAQQLSALDVQPRMLVDTASNTSQLYSYWRADKDTGRDYVYLYNAGNTDTFPLAFDAAAAAVPYVLDAWSGKQTPLLLYDTAADGRLLVNVSLAANQSTILAFVTDSPANRCQLHVRAQSGVGRVWREDGQLVALVRPDAEATVQLSSGKTVHSAAVSSLSSSTVLAPWNLSVECYAAPDVLSNSSVADNRTTIAVTLPALVPWTEQEELAAVSGVGTYTTKFAVDDIDDTAHHTLVLNGTIANTARVWVNGQLVPALDPAGGDRDISALLKVGDNSIRIVVTSTLFNAVKARIEELYSDGAAPVLASVYAEADWAVFGLEGSVFVQRWRRIVL